MTSIDLDFKDLDLESMPDLGRQSFGVVCLHAGSDSGTWYRNQLSALAATAWDAPPDAALRGNGDAPFAQWVEAYAAHLRSTGNLPANVVASGPAAMGAMLLAAEHPELVTSLVLGDPEVDVASDLFIQTVGRIRTPSLVIVAAPERTTDISDAQGIAGGIANGVFVIIDDCAVPAHHHKPSSFNEWTSSFIRIAEGLHAFGHPQEENNA